MTTPAYVQHANASQVATFNAGNVHTLTFGSALTLGSSRVAVIRTSTGSTILNATAVSGSVSGTYTFADSIVNAAASTKTYLYYIENGAAGSETVSVTTTTTGNTLRWDVLEISGTLATASLDGAVVKSAYTTTTTPATGTLTTSAVNDFLIAVLAPDTNVTTIVPGGTETERCEVDARFQIQTFVGATATGYTSSWTCGSTQPGTYLFAAFKADTGGGAATIGYQQYQQRRTTLITL